MDGNRGCSVGGVFQLRNEQVYDCSLPVEVKAAICRLRIGCLSSFALEASRYSKLRFESMTFFFSMRQMRKQIWLAFVGVGVFRGQKSYRVYIPASTLAPELPTIPHHPQCSHNYQD